MSGRNEFPQKVADSDAEELEAIASYVGAIAAIAEELQKIDKTNKNEIETKGECGRKGK